VVTAEPAPTTPPSSAVEEFDDPGSTRTVNRIIAALLVLGGVLLAVTIWFWVSTKPLHPSLEALDLMSSRRWATASRPKRDRLLAKLHALRGPLDDRIIGGGGQPVNGRERSDPPVVSPGAAPVRARSG